MPKKKKKTNFARDIPKEDVNTSVDKPNQITGAEDAMRLGIGNKAAGEIATDRDEAEYLDPGEDIAPGFEGALADIPEDALDEELEFLGNEADKPVKPAAPIWNEPLPDKRDYTPIVYQGREDLVKVVVICQNVYVAEDDKALRGDKVLIPRGMAKILLKRDAIVEI